VRWCRQATPSPAWKHPGARSARPALSSLCYRRPERLLFSLRRFIMRTKGSPNRRRVVRGRKPDSRSRCSRLHIETLEARCLLAVNINEFTTGITDGSAPREIVAGPDGNLWFTEQAGNRIGTITPHGVVAEYAIPTANSTPVGITVG